MTFPYFDPREELRNRRDDPVSASPGEDSFEARSLASFEERSAQHAREARAKAERDTARAFGPPDGGYAWDDAPPPGPRWEPRAGRSRAEARAKQAQALELSRGVRDGYEARRATERAIVPGRAAASREAGTAADLLAWMNEREPEIRHRWADS